MIRLNQKNLQFAVSFIVSKIIVSAIFASIVDLGRLHFLEDRFAYILPLLNIHNLGVVDFVQVTLYFIEILIFCYFIKNFEREISNKSAWSFSVLLFSIPILLKLATQVFYGNGFQQLAVELSYFSQHFSSMLTSILISSVYLYTSYIFLILYKPKKNQSNKIFLLPFKYWFLLMISIFGYSHFYFKLLVISIYYYYQLLVKFDFTESIWWITISVYTGFGLYIILMFTSLLFILLECMESEKIIEKNSKPILILGIALPIIFFFFGDITLDFISAILNAIIN